MYSTRRKLTLYNLKFFIHAQNMYLHLLESFVCLFIGFSMESKIFLHKDLVPFRLIPVFSIAVVNSTVYFLLAVVGIEECSVYIPMCVCVCVCVCVCWLLSRVRLFATPWTVAHLAPLSLGFFRQEYWSGLPYIHIYFISDTFAKLTC